jgi:hypothetical protein
MYESRKIMKKLVIISLVIFFLHSMQATPFIGSLKFPKNIDSVPTLCGYYKGTRFCLNCAEISQTNKISFIIDESKSCTQIYLLFTSNIVPSGLHNKIYGLKIPTNVSYALYELNKIAVCKDNEECSYSWQIDEKTLSTNRIIPEKTIIILLQPEFIDSIQSIRWNPEDHVVYLPSILISQKHGLSDKLEKAAVTLQLASMDLNAIHAPIETKIKRDDQTVCMIQR